MSLRVQLFALLAFGLCAAILFCGGTASFAQNSDDRLELHANSHASAADIGLPAYPGATFYKDTNNDSAVDLGLNLGDFHFTLKAANYVSSDSPARILAFYRKPLSRYGEVLECDHGKPVGRTLSRATDLPALMSTTGACRPTSVRIPLAITNCAPERHISTASWDRQVSARIDPLWPRLR
jgi:hypothetical protein